MENRNGLLVDFQLSQATGTAERDVVLDLLEQARERGFRPRTLGADKGYDTHALVADLRQRQVTPHVTKNTSGRRSAIDQRTTRHVGYAISQCVRKRVGGDLWLDEDGRRVSADALPRPGADPTGWLPRRDGLQPCPDGPFGDRHRASVNGQRLSCRLEPLHGPHLSGLSPSKRRCEKGAVGVRPL